VAQLEPVLSVSYVDQGLWTDERVGWLLPRAAHRWPHRTALVIEGDRLTFAELESWADLVATRLRAAGIEPGDVVLTQLPNSVEGIVAQLAAWRIGAVSAPVIGVFRARELRPVVADVRPRAVVASIGEGGRRPADELDGVLAAAGLDPVLRWSVGPGSAEGWRPFPPRPGERGTPQAVPSPASAGETCLVLFTSGTTADPKGVRHSARSLLAEAHSYRDTARIGPADTVLAPSSIAHIGGAVAATVLPSVVGCRVVAMPRWDAAAAARLCDEEEVTLGIGVPVHLVDLLERYDGADAGRRPPERFAIGGATVAPRVIERAEAAGICAWRAWGMTEAPTVTVAGPDDPLWRRAGFDGRVDYGAQVQAVGPDHVPVPPGTAGELRLRSPKQMLGYTSSEATAAQVDADGWFYTGDIGMLDDDGWLTVLGRTKDIINRGGEKFPARDIEAAILDHPAVAAAAVVGAPEPRLGEQVVAFVVLRAGASWPGDAALVAHLNDLRLARQKMPVAWRVLHALPATPTGKVRKNVLLERWDQTDSGVITSAGPD